MTTKEWDEAYGDSIEGAIQLAQKKGRPTEKKVTVTLGRKERADVNRAAHRAFVQKHGKRPIWS